MMFSFLIVLMGILSFSFQLRNNYTCDTPYYEFSKFWTNIGFCPPGRIIHDEIKNSLLSEAMQMNLLHISSLSKGAVSHIRIHWLLELMQFEQYSQSGVPIYDFSVLDKFLTNLNEINLNPVIEFMANLSGVFTKNPTHNDFYWENLSYQVAKRYLNIFGAKKILNWRFETWNEPDLQTYNILNFNTEDYLRYIHSLYIGLRMAGTNSVRSLHFPLRGPAGLFKSQTHHLLCWSVLDFCNEFIERCPLDVLTYHRKGSGENASAVLENSRMLLAKIYNKYSNLQQFKFSNDESDPISGWSTPREFQADVRYAVTLVRIILEHWEAKLTEKIFSNLETISHDNAFLSYHPNEFSQRTLLAHFRMNNTVPPHSQFIQKPVYCALGLFARLADFASDVLTIETVNGKRINVLKTINSVNNPLYYSWLIVPSEDTTNDETIHEYWKHIALPRIHISDNEIHAFVAEIIDQSYTNPFNVWHSFDSPAYPNASVREAMRYQQGPKIIATGLLTNTSFTVNLSTLKVPWLMMLRICSSLKPGISTPQNLLLTAVTHNEVLLTWQEIDATSVQCLKTYDIWFRANNTQSWINISSGWHLPFPSFHFAPSNGLNVNGLYKVRGIDIFNNSSHFSTEVAYIDIN